MAEASGDDTNRNAVEQKRGRVDVSQVVILRVQPVPGAVGVGWVRLARRPPRPCRNFLYAFGAAR